MEKAYSLAFDGYWREPNVGGLPAKSGIYGVYASTFDTGAGTVTLNRLLYIGEAGDIRDRVSNHEKWQDWKRQMKTGEVICVNAGLISPEADRQRAEAAMIFKHKPPCNTQYVDSDVRFLYCNAAGKGSSKWIRTSLMRIRPVHVVPASHAAPEATVTMANRCN